MCCLVKAMHQFAMRSTKLCHCRQYTKWMKKDGSFAAWKNRHTPTTEWVTGKICSDETIKSVCLMCKRKSETNETNDSKNVQLLVSIC